MKETKLRFNRTCEDGQMMVEFVVVFPLAILFGIIAMNALLFFSECASFDNLFRQDVCRIAASPASHQSIEQSTAQLKTDLNSMLDKEYLRVDEVSSYQSNQAQMFSAILVFTPTLFGRSFSGSVFGVNLFELTHKTSFSVSVYKPGVILQ